MFKKPFAAACIVGLVLLASPSHVSAGPKEEGLAVFDKFLTSFTAANVDEIVGLFAPDALVWGTTMQDLATSPAGVLQYFTNALSTRKPNERKASAFGPASVLVLSDNAVLVSGMWQIEQVRDNKPTVGTNRVSIALVKRGDRWLIAQFHNSPRPVPVPAAPPTQ